MSAIAVQKAKTWLEYLTEREHRGRHDTWTAARDRAAEKAGLKRTYAKTLWDRWQTMADVSGGAFMALQEAYEAAVEKNNRMADHHRAVREMIENGATDEECRAADARMVAALAQTKATAKTTSRTRTD